MLNFDKSSGRLLLAPRFSAELFGEDECNCYERSEDDREGYVADHRVGGINSTGGAGRRHIKEQGVDHQQREHGGCSHQAQETVHGRR